MEKTDAAASETVSVPMGLSREEADFLLRWAERLGYDGTVRRLRGTLSSARRWLVWIGGWENPESMQWDMGRPAAEPLRRDWRGRLMLADPTPVSFFGHRFTWFGRWCQMKWRSGYLTLSAEHAYEWPTRLYWSPNGTPWHERTRILWQRKKGSQH